ncbi:hypothetical protein MMC11_005154 [Xylographa trunciseda]|nr:hypothetical protein [Xylographa trunciseda]
MDPVTASTILQLQLEDIHDLSLGKMNENPQIEESDTDLALALYKKELQNASVQLSDRQMSWSIAQAVEADGDIINTMRGVEVSAMEDRRLAHRIAGRHMPENSQVDESTSLAEEDDVLQRLEALNVRSNSVDHFVAFAKRNSVTFVVPNGRNVLVPNGKSNG